MKEFGGFPARMQFTPIPNLLLGVLLPQISDILELKVTLHIFAKVYIKKGSPRFTTLNELLSDAGLMSNFRDPCKPPEQALREALGMAVGRGTILHLPLERDGATEDIYFINTEANREAAARIQSGEIVLGGLKSTKPVEIANEPPDIFSLYEQNIGMLTPMIAEELKDAEKQYPAGWIKDAIKEAAALNKRNWRYISRILEHWSAEGRVDGAPGGDIKKADPDKYVKGKYGHVVRR